MLNPLPADRLMLIKAAVSLTRLNRPIGIFLLLWPTLWALWICSAGWPGFHLFFVFTIGTILARSAGCVINDLADKDFDPHVERTKLRPLATKAISVKHAFLILVCLLLPCLFLVLTLNTSTLILSFGALAVMSAYPFMKRYTHFPQAILGIAFSWGIPMAFSAGGGSLDGTMWLLLVANWAWVIAYDTQYAMVDKEDDIKLGLKSTAIIFGKFSRLIIGVLQFFCLGILTILGTSHDFGMVYQIAILVAGLFFLYQHFLLSKATRENYFAAFLNNHWVGFFIFLGICGNFL